MTDKKDYTALPTEVLQAELKKIRQKELASAAFTGLLVGIMIYGLATKGFGWLYTVIPILLISINIRQSRMHKEIRQDILAEMDKRAR